MANGKCDMILFLYCVNIHFTESYQKVNTEWVSSSQIKTEADQKKGTTILAKQTEEIRNKCLSPMWACLNKGLLLSAAQVNKFMVINC